MCSVSICSLVSGVSWSDWAFSRMVFLTVVTSSCVPMSSNVCRRGMLY